MLEPEIVEKANKVLSHLKDFTSLEKDYPFVECATFGDEIKSRGFGDQSNLHYVDKPFFDMGYFVETSPSQLNATEAIN